MEHLLVPIEWKAGGDANVLEGYASTFGNVDLGGDVVVKGAFRDTIGEIKATGIPLLADHSPSTSALLGTIFDAREDDKGLLIKARFSSAPSAQDVYIKAREGHLNKMSIGYEATRFSYKTTSTDEQVRMLEGIKLWETSLIVFPMNPQATVERVKSLAECLAPGERKQLADEIANTADDAPADGDTQDTPEAGEPEQSGQQAEAAHVEAQQEPAVAAGWDHWRSEAVLAGRDPEEIADPADLARMREQLRLNDEQESALNQRIEARQRI